MTGRRHPTVERTSRLFITLIMAAAAMWLAPLPQPALASPDNSPAAQPPHSTSNLGPLPSPAPNILVSTPTIADVKNGQCDLWEAMQAVVDANLGITPNSSDPTADCSGATGSTNVIGFSPAVAGATIEVPDTVNSGELPFAWGDLTILGPITIKPSATNTETHILEMAGDATLTLIAVTVSDAHNSGGGAALLDFNHATVNLYGSNFTGNVADNDGGAINSNGSVNVVLSNFSGNEARGVSSEGNGGAINITGAGTLSVSKSNFAGNTARGGGGAIYSTSSATIEDSLFSGNIGGQDISLNKGGGAIYNDVSGGMAIARTQFAGNLAPQGNGGAVWNNSGATLVVTDTTFAANLAGDLSHATLGGGMYAMGSVTVYRSSFANNIAVRGDGGALVVDRAGIVSVGNATFVANGAPSGLGAAVVVTQTQIGGPASTFNARNLTISKNGTPTDHDSGLFVDAGNTATLGNTIIAGNINDNCGGTGTFTSIGNNLDDDNKCHLIGPGDKPNDSNANLGGPSFNGGPISSMLTMKLQRPSDAIDTGSNTICTDPLVNNEDQRSNKRPVDGTLPGNLNPICDMGAYEADGASPSFASSPSEPGPIDVGHVQVGHQVTTTLVVSNTGDFDLSVVNIALTGSNPGDFGISPSAAFTITPNAVVNFVISCTPSQANQRTALLGFGTTDVPLHAVVGFQLKCTGDPNPVAGYSSSPIPPGPITFPDTIFGQSSAAAIKVSETGNAQLQVTSGGLGGADPQDFNVSGATFNINDGGPAHTITVNCTPTDYGLRTATLTLNTNDSTQNPVVYNLSCKGIPTPSPYLLAGNSALNTPTDHGLSGAYGLALTPNSKYLYVTSYADGSVSTFTRNANSGALSFVGQDSPAFVLAQARLIATSPDGKNGYPIGQLFGAIFHGLLDPHTGEMSFPLGSGLSPAALGGAYGVAVSPDGKNVYATGASGNSVVVFSRDSVTGTLTAVQSIISTTALSGAQGLTVSPDGQNVYVTGYADSTHGTVAVFQRNAANGKLKQIQLRFEGDFIDCGFICLGLTGLKGAMQVAVSPDGANVYVASTYSGAVLAFSRSGVDGSLHIIGGSFNGVGGVTGLSGVSGIDVTPDGREVIADGYNDQAAVVFDRDPTTGLLTFRQVISKAGNGVPLNGARDLRISPDGKTVYVAAYLDNAIGVLPVANPIPLLTGFSPASANQGGPAFTLRVFGANFVPTSKVLFGAFQPATTYVSPYELDAAITSAMLTNSGSPVIQIDTPQPVGIDAFSFPKHFTIFPSASPHNPVPAIDHITPQGQLAGGSGLTLDVFGSGFINGSTVRWNGGNRATAFINSGHLQATIPQSDVSQPGASAVTVFTGSPGGGTSNTVAFTVAPPGQNSLPTLTGINPPWVYSLGAASKQIKLTITGQNFIQGSTVQLGGSNRPTLFIDSSHLQVTIFGSDLIAPTSTSITVFTPAPGGGTSNPLTFVIKKLYRLLLPIVRR